MTPEEWKRWHFAQLRGALKALVLLLVPAWLLFFVVSAIAPGREWIYGIALGTAGIFYGLINFVRASPTDVLSLYPSYRRPVSVREHYLGCMFLGAVVVAVSSWAGYVAR
jgi:hypothetical protein